MLWGGWCECDPIGRLITPRDMRCRVCGLEIWPADAAAQLTVGRWALTIIFAVLAIGVLIATAWPP